MARELMSYCAGCGGEGVIVDTACGEIIHGGRVVAVASPREELLRVDLDGEPRCDECAKERGGD